MRNYVNERFRGKRTIDRADFIPFVRSIIIRSKENEFIRLLATVELKSLLFLIRQLMALKISDQSGDQNCLQIVKNCKLFERTRRSTMPCWKIGTISLNLGM